MCLSTGSCAKPPPKGPYVHPALGPTAPAVAVPTAPAPAPAPAPVAAPAAAAPTAATPEQLLLKQWLLDNGVTTSLRAEGIARKMVLEGNISSVARLQKKVAKDGEFLSRMGMDEDEAEDACDVLNAAAAAGAAISPSAAAQHVGQGGGSAKEASLPLSAGAASAAAASEYRIGLNTVIFGVKALHYSRASSGIGSVDVEYLLEGHFCDHSGRQKEVVIKLPRDNSPSSQSELLHECAILAYVTAAADEVSLAPGVSESGCIRTYPTDLRAQVALITEHLGSGTTNLLPYLSPACHIGPDILMRELLTAVKALHTLGVMHGDIKPANVLVRLQGVSVKLVLCDLECARFVFAPFKLPDRSPFSAMVTAGLQSSGGAGQGQGVYPQPNSLKLTAAYAAPEVVRAALAGAGAPPLPSSFATDMFSVGLVCVALLSSQLVGREDESPLPPRPHPDRLAPGNDAYLEALGSQDILSAHLVRHCDRQGVGAVRFVEAITQHLCSVDPAARWSAAETLRAFQQQSVTRTYNENKRLRSQVDALADFESQLNRQAVNITPQGLQMMLEQVVATQFQESHGLLKSHMQEMASSVITSVQGEQRVTRDMVLSQMDELKQMVAGMQEQLAASLGDLHEILRRTPDPDLPHLFVLLPASCVSASVGSTAAAGDAADGTSAGKKKGLLKRMATGAKRIAKGASHAVEAVFVEEYRLVFLSTVEPHELAACGPGGLGYTVKLTRTWVRHALPILRAALLALQVGLTLYGIPVPLAQMLPGLEGVVSDATKTALASGGAAATVPTDSLPESATASIERTLKSATDQLEAAAAESPADEPGPEQSLSETYRTLLQLLQPTGRAKGSTKHADEAEVRAFIHQTCGLNKISSLTPGAPADWVLPSQQG